MTTFIALIRKEKGSAFGVEFPDFPGCISAGDTLDEAATGAKSALELHIEGMIEDGEPIPKPSSLEAVKKLTEFKGAVPVVVDVPVVRKNKRINITMDEGLIELVDELAANMGTTRSGFLAIAVRKSLKDEHFGKGSK